MATNIPELGTKDNVLDIDYWTNRWNTDDVGFHKNDAHADLVEYENDLLPEKGSIFFPLCGKTVDMAYLAHKGHKVVGLEFSTNAVEDFFRENRLTYDVTDVEGHPFKLYKCKEPNSDITIYSGDINDVTVDILGRFDAAWDRGSLVAINTSDRAKYARLLSDLMKEKSRYFIICVEYDSTVYGGPPHCVTAHDVKTHFGSDFDVQLLKRYSILSPRFEEFGLKEIYATLYRLTRNSSIPSIA